MTPLFAPTITLPHGITLSTRKQSYRYHRHAWACECFRPFSQVPRRECDDTLREVTKDVASAEVREMAQYLAARIKGLGVVGALELLARIGMVVNHYEEE